MCTVRRSATTGLFLVTVFTVSLAGCGPGPAQAPTAPASPVTVAPSEEPTPLPTVATPSPSTEPAPTALDDLMPFIDAARATDVRLHDAAARVNGAVHASEVVVDVETATAVQAADPHNAAVLIPAGLPDPLLEAALLVYSDLASRCAAMRDFGWGAPRVYPRFLTEAEEGLADLTEGEGMVQCLTNGSPAAARFDGDLEVLVTLAGGTPRVVPVAPDSLAAAEVAFRTALIWLGNNGCASCGGYLATTFEPITWDDAPAGATTRTGTVGAGGQLDIEFEITYEPSTGWTPLINAC